MNELALTKALSFTLKEEGGYADDPNDHGGATMHGVTQAEFDRWNTRHGFPLRPVKTITDAEVRQLYAEDYWQAGHCDDMTLSLAIAHFDWCVNHGPTGATRTLQQTLMIKDDGVYGPKTYAALQAQDHNELWREYNRCRRDHYEAILKADPTQEGFRHEWMGRIDRLDAFLESL
jgi:lysozyme family protein